MRWSFVVYLLVLLFLQHSIAAQQSDVDRLPAPPNEAASPIHIDDSIVVVASYNTVEGSQDGAASNVGFRSEGETELEEEKSAAKEKRDDVAEQIRVAERQVKQEQETQGVSNSQVAKPAEVSSEEEIKLRLLKQLDVILAQREQQVVTLEDTNKELAERTRELQRVNNGELGFEEPYSFLLLDQLQDELATLQSNLASSQSNQSIVNEDIVQAKVLLEQKEKAYRLAKENKEVIATNLTNDNSVPALEVKLATETLNYRKCRLEIVKARAEIHASRIVTVEQRLQTIRPDAVFTESDLKSKLSELDGRESELRRKLSLVERAMEDSDAKWLDDRKLLKSDATPTARETEELELRRLKRQALQAKVASSSFRLELLSQTRQAWEHRYAFANSISTRQQEIEIEKAAVKNREQRDRDLTNKMLQLDELRKSISSFESKIEAFPNEGEGVELRRIVERQKEAVREMMVTLEEDVASIQLSRRILVKLLADIQGDSGRYSLSKIWETIWYYTNSVWNTELTTVDDRPITIGKVILAFAIFLGGFWLARFISRRLRVFLTGKLRVDESAAAAFQSLAFYGLVMSFLLGALNFVSIPLTVFTFLGGALAIGVGFGSQNIISNFISGLILLAERPVKVGDLIQMGELYGNVETIGARSTIVRTGTNLRLIVPNSKFLENNVINLTHGVNDIIRTKICVGVSYGSDTRQVAKLLTQAAVDHGVVLQKPEPYVLFREFGDNSLNFELHFWLNVNRPMDRLRLESDLRYRVDSLFKEGGIVISFPQRDLHIDSLNPIEIRLLSEKQIANSRSDAA